jgi:hypothetical protein
VENELTVKVCVETYERVIDSGGNKGYLHDSSMILIAPSLCLNYSFISDVLSVFLRTSKNMFDYCNPMIPKVSSSTDPGLIL